MTNSALAGRKLEIIVGTLVIAAAVIFVFLALAMRGYDFTQKDSYNLRADFMNVSGVVVGSDVMMAGVKIGSVTSIGIDEQTYLARVGVQINRNFQLPLDSVIKVTANGLLGEAFLLVEAGSEEELFLQNGEQFEHTQSAVSIVDLISRALFSPSAKEDIPAASAD